MRRQLGRWLGAIVLSLSAACLPSAAAALCGGGFASEDLTVACLSRHFETETDATSRAVVASLLLPRLVARGRSPVLGFGPGPTWTRLGRTLEPVLRYDDNVNEGSPKGPLRLGGLEFTIPEDQVRRADIVLGGRVVGAARRILGVDTWVDLRGGAMLTYAATEHVALTDASAEICLRQGTGRQSSLRACASGAYQGRKLQNDQAAILSIEHVRTTFVANRPVLFNIGLRRRFLDDHRETGLSAGVEAIIAPNLVIGSAGTLYASEPGENVERRSLTLFSAGRIGGMTGNVFVRHGESWGSNVLGIDRRDRTLSVGLTTALPRGLLLDIVYRKRRGTIDYFDDVETEIGLRFAARRF